MKYSDIDCDLCVKCGECCKVKLVLDTDKRTLDYYMAVGLRVSISETC